MPCAKVVVVVQLLGGVPLFAIPCTQTPLSFIRSQSLLNLCPLSQWCHPTISSSVIPSPPASIFPSNRVLSNELALCIRWQKYWSFSFSISPSNEYSGLISFRTDWFDLLAVEGILKSLPNTTVQRHQFFSAQLLYSLPLTSLHDYWKHHSFDYTDLCQQSDVSAF